MVHEWKRIYFFWFVEQTGCQNWQQNGSEGYTLLSLSIPKQRGAWAPSQYPKRRLSVRSREVSKPRDWYFKLSYGYEIWQAHRQHRYRSACQISERSDISKYKSRGFETLRDLAERRLFGYWDGALLAPLQSYNVNNLPCPNFNAGFVLLNHNPCYGIDK